MSDPTLFQKAVALIDAANAEDPNQESADGRTWPKELLYAQRMSEMLDRFAPDADDAQRLAIRAQHIQRWKSARSDYPEGRQGYLQWRTQLYRFHADTAGQLLAEAGYGDDVIERVKQAVGKRALKVNPTGIDQNFFDNSAVFRTNFIFHFHGFQDDQRFTSGDFLPRGDQNA